jgi:hypothetical protein
MREQERARPLANLAGMSDDLLDAKAAVDWAMIQFEVLVKRVNKWRQSKTYSVTRPSIP